MSKRYDQSETRPFKSIYMDGYITPPNYLCELIFQRRGEYDKNAMPQWLWQNPKFKSKYVGQLTKINKLLKTYEFSTLLKAFSQTKVLSVDNPDFLLEAEKIHQGKLGFEKITSKVENDGLEKPKPAFGKVNKLREL